MFGGITGLISRGWRVLQSGNILCVLKDMVECGIKAFDRREMMVWDFEREMVRESGG